MNFNLRPVLPAPTNYFSAWRLENTLFWNACNDLAFQRQASADMVGLTMLGALAILAQGRYDVRLPYGAVRPLSLNVCIVNDSGEGKTAVENEIMAPLKLLQAKEYLEYQKRLEDYQRDLDQWQLEHDILRQKVRSVISKNGGLAQKEKQMLRDHNDSRPKQPRQFRLLYPNTTLEALFLGLSEAIPTAALASDEGDTYFQSTVSRARGHLNKMWGGDSTTITRATKPDIVLYNARVSTLLMIQPGILTSHLTSADRDSGWLARFIVCAPASVRGSRHYNLDEQKPGEDWHEAEKRLTSLARQNLLLVDSPDTTRKVLQFSPAAAQCWIQLANEVESEMAPGRRFQDCPDHASKLTDNIARVSALLHIFEEEEGDISEATLRMSVELCNYFSVHFQQVMMPPPQEVQDAQLLNTWFNELRAFNNRILRYNDVRQRAPSPLRDKKRLREAIEVLLAHNEIGLFTQGKTRMIDLVPHMGPPPMSI
ncbi:hypothetical protein GCM10010082_04520 [Kushneria pakistanensis]|uniref:DUF3987 domain-containing protein n=1 Tax=Kushneria pakistanensis TaxID=1508770 RepID=A0ABQ3FBT6_9GAMM|nr:YfjI family protein [Kushneria pakistanensis]GHC16675.1 hypothetical protein GCM10010082_04520 [Kushneria pakistanensis]